MDLSLLRYAFLHAVNCYQYAIGYRRLVIAATFEEDTVNSMRASFDWARLSPGKHRKLKREDETSLLWSRVIDGCKDDGLIDIGREFKQAKGYRTVAAYRQGPEENVFDYHFSYFDGRSWCDKFLSSDPVARYRKSGGVMPPSHIWDYQFDRFFLSPYHIRPQCLTEGIHRKTVLTFGQRPVGLVLIEPSYVSTIIPSCFTVEEYERILNMLKQAYLSPEVKA